MGLVWGRPRLAKLCSQSLLVEFIGSLDSHPLFGKFPPEEVVPSNGVLFCEQLLVVRELVWWYGWVLPGGDSTGDAFPCNVCKGGSHEWEDLMGQVR